MIVDLEGNIGVLNKDNDIEKIKIINIQDKTITTVDNNIYSFNDIKVVEVLE